MYKYGRNLLLVFSCFVVITGCNQGRQQDAVVSPAMVSKEWSAPDTASIRNDEEGRLIKYGRELVVHTSHYLGPKGTVAHLTNGMNCQNCHLDAGTKKWGNNYSAVASTYPKFRARSGSLESIEKRVNDCMVRSLNGSELDSTGKEMRAIVAYIKWVGKDVPKDTTPPAAGLMNVPMLERAASPEKGKIVFESRCISCHGDRGQGKADSSGFDNYKYPPLWGPNSYNTGAGLYRLSRIAGYIKANMPFDAKEEEQKLTDEQAWDVAAYISSRQRPDKKFKQDWPDISKKPFDHPYGPYSDTFSEQQHKFGPWQGILSAQKK